MDRKNFSVYVKYKAVCESPVPLFFSDTQIHDEKTFNLSHSVFVEDTSHIH